ncbi:uncharacterized protein LOC136092222 [Hydra vulgaris]|uniref:Uncharacterized protein LOC136092222 n=1 Tax=Hydra vulgaris TaxID=6087 RepID=A0ABM4DNA6_HYDVU
MKINMAVYNNTICRYQYRDSAEYSNSIFLIMSYAVNATFTLVANATLIFGLYKTSCNKRYTRNERLAILLSFIDILKTILVLSSQSALLKNINNIGCLQIAVTSFFRAWFLGLSGCTFLMVSCERYFTVFYNNIICGVNIKDSYYIGCFVFIMFITFSTALVCGVVCAISSMYLQFVLYFCTGCTTLVLLLLIIIANILMLIKIKKKLKFKSLRVQANTEIENHITKTVTLISLTHVMFYAPCLVAQYYLSFSFSKGILTLIPSAFRGFLWTLVIRDTSLWINAIVYTLRNRKINTMYASKISSLFGTNKDKIISVEDNQLVTRSVSTNSLQFQIFRCNKIQ